LDTSRVSIFTQIEQYPYISKRFALERFLGLTEEEIAKNEKLWSEENNKDVVEEPKGSDLRNIGVSVSDIESDEGTAEELENPPEEGGPEGPEIAGPVTPGAPTGGGAAAPGTPGSPPTI
jgi:hypothetical protein